MRMQTIALRALVNITLGALICSGCSGLFPAGGGPNDAYDPPGGDYSPEGSYKRNGTYKPQEGKAPKDPEPDAGAAAREQSQRKDED